MTAACDLLEVELALDRIDAELAAELPAHMRAFAKAHAMNAPSPPAPAVLHRSSTLATAQNALAHPVLQDRGLALARLVVPIAIDDDRRVVAARHADPTWDALAALAAARDAAARERFGADFVSTMHRFYGVTIQPRDVPWPATLHAWHAPDGVQAVIDDIWQALFEQHGASGSVEFRRAAVRPRTFVIEPMRHVLVLVPDKVTSPAARFAVLHELGHALVALLAPAGVPRVIDEAAASFVARAIEDAAHPWYSAHAHAARERRLQLACALDAIERAMTAARGDSTSADRDAPTRPTERPPWALWHDPATQAAYVEAEAIADRWCASRESLVTLIAAERARIDSSTQ